VIAQQGATLHIRGQVTDAATHLDVSGVTVSAVEARHSTTTDVNGFFNLELREGTKPGQDIRIHVQKKGYRADDLTEAASETVTHPIRISPLVRPSAVATPLNSQPPLQRMSKFVVMIPFDTKTGAFPIPVDENPDDPLSRTYEEIHSLATYGTIPDSVRQTKEMGQITWNSMSVSMDESTRFLGRLLQYDILQSIDMLQRDSLTVFVGYPAEANAGIEPPDPQTYPDDKLAEMLGDNRFYRPFLYRPNPGQLMKMRMPKDTVIEFKEQGSPPQKWIIEFKRPDYFRAEFAIEPFLGTGPGSLPKYFKTAQPETVMQWPFFITMRYSIEHHPTDTAFNPDLYAKWLDALYDGLTKKLVLTDSDRNAADRNIVSVPNTNVTAAPLSGKVTDEHAPPAKVSNNELATEGKTAEQNADKIQPPKPGGLNGNVSPVQSDNSDGILEEISSLLEKDRELVEMDGCPAGKSTELRRVGEHISYYLCVKQCFSDWKTVNPKNLDFGSLYVSQPDGKPTLALIEIPCLPQKEYGLCVTDQAGTFTSSTGCLKQKVKTDYYGRLEFVIHVENVDGLVKLWKEFARVNPK
jgi:hypothetical protein